MSDELAAGELLADHDMRLLRSSPQDYFSKLMESTTTDERFFKFVIEFIRSSVVRLADPRREKRRSRVKSSMSPRLRPKLASSRVPSPPMDSYSLGTYNPDGEPRG